MPSNNYLILRRRAAPSRRTQDVSAAHRFANSFTSSQHEGVPDGIKEIPHPERERSEQSKDVRHRSKFKFRGRRRNKKWGGAVAAPPHRREETEARLFAFDADRVGGFAVHRVVADLQL